jgi:GntR family transcriptional regulator
MDVVHLELQATTRGSNVAQSDGQAAYQRIATELRARIANETYRAGDRLPSSAELQDEFGVSNTVVKSALGLLRNEHLIIGQQGKGVYVREGVTPTSVPVPVDVNALAARVASLEEQLAALSQRVGQLDDASARG